MKITDLVAVGLTGIGLINCLSFCVAYWIKSKGAWVRDEVGHFMMLFFGCLGFLFALVLSNRIYGDYKGREILVLILYFTLVLTTFWPIRLLLGKPWRMKKEKEDERQTDIRP